MLNFTKKDILDISSLSVEDISLILDTSERMKEISERPVKKVRNQTSLEKAF